MMDEFPQVLKTCAAARPPSGMARFRELAELWDEAAVRAGGKLFAARFATEIQSLERHWRDFPGKSPALPLRVLELKMFRAFRNEFPASPFSNTARRLRVMVETPSFS